MLKRLAAPIAALALTLSPAAAQAVPSSVPSLRGYTNCGHGVYITKGGTCQFATAIAVGAERYDVWTSGRRFYAYSTTTQKWYPVKCEVTVRHRGTCWSGKGYRQVIQIQQAKFDQWYQLIWGS